MFGRRRISVENTRIREVRSVVVPAQFFVLGIPMAFLPAALGFLMLLSCGMLVAGRDISDQNLPFFVIGCGIAAFVILISGLVLSGIREFSRTTYTIYPDRVEYAEGFWNRQRRTVAFDEVIDVGLTEGVLQRTRGAGTVTLTIDP